MKKNRVQLGIKCWIKEPRRIQGRVSISTFHLISCRNRPKPYIYPYGGMPRLQSWFFSCRHVFVSKKARKTSFHASWSSDITDKCPNVFHYVILSISKLWNSFGTSGILFPSYLGHKNRPKMPFLGKKVSFWTFFSKFYLPYDPALSQWGPMPFTIIVLHFGPLLAYMDP